MGKVNENQDGKFDKDKPRAGLMLSSFANALYDVSLVTSHGAAKYKAEGWREVENGIERYWDASIRHLLGSRHENDDPESGLPHLAHAICSLLIVYELQVAAQSEKTEKR